MQYPAYHYILNDFNLSIIIPLTKGLENFKQTLLSNNSYFQRNGIEVLVILSERNQQTEVIDLIKQYPLINWIIVVKEDTDFNASKNLGYYINIGIKCATKLYIMICGPSDIFYNDVMFRLRYIIENYRFSFTIGILTHNITDTTNRNYINYSFLGSILIKKSYLFKIGGCCELSKEPMHNCILQLEYHGIKKLYVPDAISIQYKDKTTESITAPNHVKINSSQIRDFNFINSNNYRFNNLCTKVCSIIYDYRHNIYANELCEKYLQSFKNYIIYLPGIATKKLKIVALIQTHNEKEQVPHILLHLDKLCDGIILLDDDSTDGTFESAISEKLILKVQKDRVNFNDYENRNILLNVASYINCEWLFFIDADERFDERYNDLYKAVENYTSNTLNFLLVNIWDSPEIYRADINDSAAHLENGILSRPRMFKNNNGRVQIILKDKRKLHFSPIPSSLDSQPVKILLLHYGLEKKENRLYKYKYYKIEDDYGKRKLNEYYEYLIDENPTLLPVKEIVL